MMRSVSRPSGQQQRVSVRPAACKIAMLQSSAASVALSLCMTLAPAPALAKLPDGIKGPAPVELDAALKARLEKLDGVMSTRAPPTKDTVRIPTTYAPGRQPLNAPKQPAVAAPIPALAPDVAEPPVRLPATAPTTNITPVQLPSSSLATPSREDAAVPEEGNFLLKVGMIVLIATAAAFVVGGGGEEMPQQTPAGGAAPPAAPPSAAPDAQQREGSDGSATPPQ